MGYSNIRLCYVTTDIFLGRTPVYSESTNQNYIIGQRNNAKGGIDFSGMKYGEESFYSERSDKEFLQYGDVLLNTLGGGSVGRIGQWLIKDGQKYITDGHIMILRGNERINPRYMYYALSSKQKELEDAAVGSTNQAFLTITDIYKRTIPNPSLPEQQRIADFLDRKCADIGNVLEKTKSSIEEYKKLKQSVITEAVTKGIRGERPMKYSGSTWFGKIPASWDANKLKYTFTIRKRIVGEDGNTVLAITQKGVKPKDMSNGNGQFAESYANYQIVHPGDFAMNHMDLLTGWVDISKFEGVTSPDYRVFTLDDTTKNCPRYYLYMMQMCYSNRIFYSMGQGVSGMGRWRLPADMFNNFIIACPPLEEQQEIADYLDIKCSEIDSLIASKEKFITELESYKKNLIYEYVTGKKEVL